MQSVVHYCLMLMEVHRFSKEDDVVKCRGSKSILRTEHKTKHDKFECKA